MLDGVGTGNLCRLREQNHYGRELPVATVLASGEVALVKWLKKAIGARVVARNDFDTDIRARIPDLVKPGAIVDWITRGNLISVRLDYANVPVNAHIDSAGNALIDPPERENLPEVCRACDQLEHDKTVAIVNSPTYAWRHLGLVEPDGTPTRRGMIFSFFHSGEGLAVAGAPRKQNYSNGEIVFFLCKNSPCSPFPRRRRPLGGGLRIFFNQSVEHAAFPRLPPHRRT